MNSEKIIMCIVALILGMLLANMLKNVCGCKLVEGQCEHVCCSSSDPQCEPPHKVIEIPPDVCEGGRTPAYIFCSGQHGHLFPRVPQEEPAHLYRVGNHLSRR